MGFKRKKRHQRCGQERTLLFFPENHNEKDVHLRLIVERNVPYSAALSRCSEGG